MNNEKVLLGKKGNQDSGYVYYPYLTISKFMLPIKLVRIDKDKGPVFTKIKSYE